jgi:hypothetical protein
LRSLRRRDFGRLVSQGQSYHFAGFKSNQPGYKSVYAGGRRAARDFCRVAVVEASAAAVRIKNGSWGVASGRGPDMLQGTHDGLRRFLLRPPGAATWGRTRSGTESREHCGYAGRGVRSLFPYLRGRVRQNSRRVYIRVRMRRLGESEVGPYPTASEAERYA